ncbi:MAG: polysaccharide biosynthesis tyrosine autokinase, partial [Thalassovita sp.]|nr:polysaccharide biosynthesis tyrosine autokinase [Thalassovita sp.]
EEGGQMMPGLLLSDALTVDSESRVLASREVTLEAVQRLGLQQVADPSLSFRQWVAGWLAPVLGASIRETAAPRLPDDLSAQRRLEALRKSFVRGLKVQRAGDSFVIDISYTSPDLAFASRAVNTLIESYQGLSGAQHRKMAERNRDWLSDRIAQLRGEVQAAETAVADFQRENGLLAPDGALLPTEVALNAATEELVRLRGQALAVDVRLQQLSEQIATGEPVLVQIQPVERTPALTEFEARYTALRQQEQELLLSWDEAAPAITTLRRQMAKARALILAEYHRIEDRLLAQSEALSRQLSSTESLIAGLRDQYGEEMRKTVLLRGLQREANAKREQYERLLEDYTRTSQLLTFDASSARVIAWAAPPDSKAGPRARQIVLLSGFAGLVLAMGAIYLLDAFDNGFRSASDVSAGLGLPFLGVVPTLRSDRTAPQPATRSARKAGSKRAGLWRNQARAFRWADFAVLSPGPVGTRTMHRMGVQLAMQKGQLNPDGDGIVIGVTSSVRHEGRSMTALGFASYLARQNEKVAFVDLDLACREVSRRIASELPDANRLRLFLKAPETALKNRADIPELPGLFVLGNGGPDPVPATDVRNADRFDAMLRHLRRSFDVVIVDLPPVRGAAETQLLAALCDGLIYVIKWGATPRDLVRSTLKRHGLNRDWIFGVLYTGANLKKYRSYNRGEVSIR